MSQAKGDVYGAPSGGAPTGGAPSTASGAYPGGTATTFPSGSGARSSAGAGGYDSEVVVVYGIEIRNPEAAYYASRIISVSITIAVIALLDLILLAIFAPSLIVSGIIVLLISLLQPACGYFGAKNRNITLVRTFLCCTSVLIVLQIISIVVNVAAGAITVFSLIAAILMLIINGMGAYFSYLLLTKAPEFFTDANIPRAEPVAMATAPHAGQPRYGGGGP